MFTISYLQLILLFLLVYLLFTDLKLLKSQILIFVKFINTMFKKK